MRKYKSFFNNKKVIITGHTGFKGSWLTLWLQSLGANILGISNDIPTKPSHFQLLNLNRNIKSKKINIQNLKLLKQTIVKFNPDYIFHLAAQAIVKKSYKDPVETWQTNLLGTLNILESIRNLGKKRLIVTIITSDKVYKNVETKKGYKENSILGGVDPYGASKSAAEICIQSYIKSFFSNKNKISIVTARAGNVIGGGDWSENRLIPDCIRSWSKNKFVIIRNQNSTRPWQNILDVVNAYLNLSIKAKIFNRLHGHAFNFGPSMNNNFKVSDVLKKTKFFWKEAKWKVKKNEKFYENNLLNLNTSKAKKILKYKPLLNFHQTIQFTISWYKDYYKNKKRSVKSISLSQIKDFEKLI